MSTIGIKDIPLFVPKQHQSEVNDRRTDVDRLTQRLAGIMANRKGDVVEVKEQIELCRQQEHVLTQEIARVTKRLEVESDGRRDEMATVLARIRKLDRDFQAFVSMVVPRIKALEKAETDRVAAENDERKARADPRNWAHAGVFAYNLLLSEQNVQSGNAAVWSRTEVPCWTCCQDPNREARGCRRVDTPGVVYLNALDR
jgi:hypothetical protein